MFKSEKDFRKDKKDLIKRIKRDESFVVITEEYTAGNNLSMEELKFLLCCAFDRMITHNLLNKDDLKKIFDYATTSDEIKKDKIASSLVGLDLSSDLDDEDDVKFEPKKKRGRPRKNV